MGRIRSANYRGFHELLEEQVSEYRGDLDGIILQVPTFFRLLTNLLEDSRVSKEARILINAGIAYFVAPYDVHPEEIHGAEGYLDDLYLCTYIVRELRAIVPAEVLQNAWEGEADLLKTTDLVFEKAGVHLGAKTFSILQFVGLS